MKIGNRDDTRFLAFLVSTVAHSIMGTCDRLRVACGIVKDKRLRGIGYNGSVTGLPHCDDVDHLMDHGHCIATRHGEANAISNTDREHLVGAQAIVTATPCISCVKDLAEAGVAQIDVMGAYFNARGKEHIDAICAARGIRLVQHDVDWAEVFQQMFDMLARKGGILRRAGYRLRVVKEPIPEVKLHIILVARLGAGKGTVAQMIERIAGREYTVESYRFSDPLNEMLDSMRLARSRSNQQAHSRLIRQEYGEGELGRIALERIGESPAQIVIIDGARRLEDVRYYLMALRGAVLLHVDASQRDRWEWVRHRAARPGEAAKTWEQFQEEDNAESERRIDELAAQADVRILNNGTLADLEARVRECLAHDLKLAL